MTAPRLRDLMARGVAALRQGGIETPELDAALLLGFLLGLDRAALYARMLDAVPNGVPDAFDALIARRLRREPVAYLTGTKEFMGLMFAVGPSVLVPRPETELLVEWALRRIAAQAGSTRVVDVGTGSGAIAVALAAMTPSTHPFASDISREALAIARCNARRHGVAGRIAFVRGDLLSWLGRPVEMIVANLPYLTNAQSDATDLRAEPRGALAGGGRDGFDLYRALIPHVPARLAPGGAFAFEIDPAQAETAVALCEATFPAATVTLHPDLAGHARFVTVENIRRGDACIALPGSSGPSPRRPAISGGRFKHRPYETSRHRYREREFLDGIIRLAYPAMGVEHPTGCDWQRRTQRRSNIG